MKLWQSMLLYVLFFGVGLVLLWRIGALLEPVKPWWRGRVLDCYVETPARVDEVFAKEVKDAKSSSVGFSIMIAGRYEVAGVEFKILDVLERVYERSSRVAERRVAVIREEHVVLPVFYDPAAPARVVVTKANLPGFFQVAFMLFMSGIFLLVGLVLTLMGATGLKSTLWPERLKQRLP